MMNLITEKGSLPYTKQVLRKQLRWKGFNLKSTNESIFKKWHTNEIKKHHLTDTIS